MTISDFLRYMASGHTVTVGSEVHLTMHRLSQEAMRITTALNNAYHTQEEIIAIMEELTGQQLDSSFSLFPPFYTDCGKNIHIGSRVFINMGCKFQDQGGIIIGDDVLIGHNVVIATLNHSIAPERRGDMEPRPVIIGNKVWIGSNSTLLPGVTIGEGAAVGAGSVVTNNVESRTVVAGVPAKIIKRITV